MDGLNFAMITGAAGICMKIARGRFFRAILSRRSLALSLSLSLIEFLPFRAPRTLLPLLYIPGARRHRSRINASPLSPSLLHAMEDRIALVQT